MKQQSAINKTAWEYRAYEFWNQRDGAPSDKAKEIMANPKASLKKHQDYFQEVTGKRIANVCGSNGRKAVPLALLGADVTVFDISEANRRYALELAACAETEIEYVVGDIYDIDLHAYQHQFDVLYLEGGILHYFHDLEAFTAILFALLKPGGKLILSDYHPIKHCINQELHYIPRYFDQDTYEENIAYQSHFDPAEQADFPKVMLRHYTMSEIVNTVISSGFRLAQLDEHRGWNGENIPWEFTIVATR
ncbi:MULTISPECIES: bifunctional 2-polyprenyl-6-hydroxyphenol methylase/3-demethylubiquinol 3-O-methyltransferase UbiG [Exiguobacterium]|uniref:class I SAM-dependent methyltransferase n=1 Tax=Exiguobacterium TaxID=33986 RepID=UPI00047B19C5|nr:MULTISPECIES: class I SAM-dependent methyltransferase [Exiguobacterium]MCT4780520.1 class I SAM-dependent methyltransferase [Exiguobacterium soli]